MCLQPLDQYDEERSVFIHDWFHTQGDVLAMSLNRQAVRVFGSIGLGIHAHQRQSFVRQSSEPVH